MKLKYFILGVLFAFILFALAGTSFFFGKKSTESENISESKIETSPTLALVPTIKTDNKEVVKEQIVFAFKNEDFSILEKYLKNPVNFRIENSGCCQPQTPIEAIEQLEYLKSAKGTWDFGKDNEVSKSLAATYPDHYSNAIIGISSDFYSVAFQLDSDSKIEKISISASYKLLLE